MSSTKCAYDFSCPVMVAYKVVAYKKGCSRSKSECTFFTLFQKLMKEDSDGFKTWPSVRLEMVMV